MPGRPPALNAPHRQPVPSRASCQAGSRAALHASMVSNSHCARRGPYKTHHHFRSPGHAPLCGSAASTSPELGTGDFKGRCTGGAEDTAACVSGPRDARGAAPGNKLEATEYCRRAQSAYRLAASCSARGRALPAMDTMAEAAS
ncbi:hypothetical protein OH77DRAFT_1010160 [Trametes cingulata]|nr:hypothetical protein OH77DRAFT_832878 [Trametes cingulata]KAI0359189.1 hypothetical protein OH77DRAFT_1010160 [Trametes cingulata]